MECPRPHDEPQRLVALRRLGILDTSAEDDFDFLTRIAAELCQTPYAFTTFVDEQRVWIKSAFGLSGVAEVPRDADYCSLAILTGQFFEITDLAADPRTAQMPFTLGGPCFRMYTAANLITTDGYRVGALCVLDQVARELSDRQKALLLRLARQVMALAELRARDRELEAALAELSRLATTDDLTGLLNRRAILRHLTDEAARARRSRFPLAVIMIDIDHFKQVNDRYGHAMGDRVLAEFGSLLRTTVRETDFVGRYGGEELCIILPDTDLAGAVIVAEDLRLRFAALEHRDGDQSLGVTASFGVAATDQGVTCEPASLLLAADNALYAAKDEGRNRVRIHHS